MIWKENLKIGVAKVDKQHKELFNRLNDFIKVVRNKKGKINEEKIQETLNFMEEYVVVHFNSEEKIQQKYDYPNYEEHHRIHEEFKAEVAKFKKQFESGNYDEDLIMEFSGRLLTWLINHVADEDQKIADYIDNETESI